MFFTNLYMNFFDASCKINIEIIFFIKMCMENLSPEQVAVLATSIAIDLCKDKTILELNVIRNIASQVSSAIFTIISQKTLIDSNKTKN